MFGWFFKKDVQRLEKETKNSFREVKKDMNSVGKWIKHLDKQDKKLFSIISSFEKDLSTLRNEMGGLREGINLVSTSVQNKQVFKKLPVLDRQTGVDVVQKAVQTAVQTDNIYDILKGLSGNERLIVMTIMNNDMKLSYEDLALLLGKERSTVRGQVNSIKQKSEGLIHEFTEKNGKKRLYIDDEVKAKMKRCAKVRSGKKTGESG